MARFALITDDDKTPMWVIIEDNGLEVYGEGAEGMKGSFDFRKADTLEKAIGSGYSNYDIEVADYSGANKKRADEAIATIEKNVSEDESNG